jgi:hypothetical protein
MGIIATLTGTIECSFLFDSAAEVPQIKVGLGYQTTF